MSKAREDAVHQKAVREPRDKKRQIYCRFFLIQNKFIMLLEHQR